MSTRDEEPRYWALELEEFLGDRCVTAIVDENEGGIIAYVAAHRAAELVELLNDSVIECEHRWRQYETFPGVDVCRDCGADRPRHST